MISALTARFNGKAFAAIAAVILLSACDDRRTLILVADAGKPVDVVVASIPRK